MPTYLLHGFRWIRLNIRMHIIINDLEDAASEWIMAPATSRALLQSFYEKYDFLPHFSPLSDHISHHTEVTDSPVKQSTLSKGTNKRTKFHHLLRRQLSLSTSSDNHEERNDARLNASSALQGTLDESQNGKFNDWSPIKLLEQYDPDEMYSCSEPYAFVADYVVKVDLSVLLDEEKQKYEIDRSKQHMKNIGTSGSRKSEADGIFLSQDEPGWLEKLRDELEANEDIGWFVINCGDEERKIEDLESRDESESPTNASLNGGWREILKGKNFISRCKAPGSEI